MRGSSGAATMPRNRNEEWAGFTAETKIHLLAGDLDHKDEQMAELRASLSKMLWAMIGILISTTTAAITLLLAGVTR
jgi:hypothetical protein